MIRITIPPESSDAGPPRRDYGRQQDKRTPVINVCVVGDAPAPYLSPTVARFILTNLGVGGFAYVRTPYLDTFYYAGRVCGVRIEAKQCVHAGALMHRITRVELNNAFPSATDNKQQPSYQHG